MDDKRVSERKLWFDEMLRTLLLKALDEPSLLEPAMIFAYRLRWDVDCFPVKVINRFDELFDHCSPGVCNFAISLFIDGYDLIHGAARERIELRMSKSSKLMLQAMRHPSFAKLISARTMCVAGIKSTKWKIFPVSLSLLAEYWPEEICNRPEVVEFASDPRWEVRVALAKAWRNSASPENLRALLFDNIAEVRLEALRSLLNVDRLSATEYFVTALQDPGASVRAGVCLLVDQLQDPTFLPLLLDRASDVSAAVSLRAYEGMERLDRWYAIEKFGKFSDSRGSEFEDHLLRILGNLTDVERQKLSKYLPPEDDDWAQNYVDADDLQSVESESPPDDENGPDRNAAKAPGQLSISDDNAD